MSATSKLTCQKLLDHIFTTTGYTPPSGVFASFHSADPGETGANELAYTGYGTRPSIVFLAASGRAVISGSSLVNFPENTSAQVTATHYGIWSAATNGEFMGGGALVSSLDIPTGSQPKLSPGGVTLSWNTGTGLDDTVNMSDYLANTLLDFTFRNQAFTRPIIKLAITTTLCTDSTLGTEVTGGNYSRLVAAVWDAASQTASGAATANTNIAIFAAPSATWGVAEAIAIMDGDSSNMLFYGNDVADPTVTDADLVQFLAGALTVNLT